MKCDLCEKWVMESGWPLSCGKRICKECRKECGITGLPPLAPEDWRVEFNRAVDDAVDDIESAARAVAARIGDIRARLEEPAKRARA